MFDFPTCARPSTGTTPWLRRSTRRSPSTWQTSTTRVTRGSRRRWHFSPPGATKNSSYVAALTQLSNLVLVKFSSDTVDCNAVQYSVVQYNIVQISAVQCSEIGCSAVQLSARYRYMKAASAM